VSVVTETLMERLGEARREPVPAGTVLVRAGDEPDRLLLVVEGQLEVTTDVGGRPLALDRLGPGDLVGEVSLVAPGPARATVTASTDAVVHAVALGTARAVVDDDPELLESITAISRERLDRHALLLVLTELLGTDDPAMLSTAVRSTPLRRVPPGTVLIREGEVGTTALLIVTGRLLVTRQYPEGPREVARLGRGQVVGERGLVGDEARSATVTTIRDSVVAEIDRDAFTAIARRHPDVALALVRQLVERIGRPVAAERSVVTSVAVASVTPEVNTRVLTTRFADALRPLCDVRVVTPASVDRAIGVPGASTSAAHGPAATLVAEHLHAQEMATDVLLLEMGPDADEWSHHAARAADRVVVVLRADANDEERARARRLLADVPAVTSTIAVLDHAPDTDRPRDTSVVRDELGVDDVLHVNGSSSSDYGRVARLAASKGVALVLGGGGARGFAHIGVRRALHELGVPIDLVVGSSIGAAIGGGIAQAVPVEESEAVAARMFDDLLDYTLPIVSLIRGERISAAALEQFGGWDFEDTWIPFKCVATNLTTSRSEVLSRGPIAPMIRASVAIPGVMPPVPRGDDLLVDGGLLSNLPVEVAAADGRCGTIIAVDVAPPRGPRAHDDYGMSVSGWKALRARLGGSGSSHPGIAAVLTRSMLVGAMAAREQALDSAGVDLLLELHIRGVSLLDFDDVHAVSQEGYDLAIPRIEEWLASRSTLVA
jgi:predicted acylesterase/phospholipase RssA/CRP-like cAMP-binding protein